jgi:hypothetical protein
MSSYAISEIGKDWISLFLCLVPYGTRDKCPSFCCKDSFVNFLNCRFTRMSIFNGTLQSVLSEQWLATKQELLTLESQSQVFVFLCAELCRSAFSGIVTRGKHNRPNFTELVLESSLTRIHRKTIHFCSKWQWYWQWHRWCSSRKLHTGLTNANCRPNVHSVGQKSIGLKFSKSRTGSDVRYSCHHNSSPPSSSFTMRNK